VCACECMCVHCVCGKVVCMVCIHVGWVFVSVCACVVCVYVYKCTGVWYRCSYYISRFINYPFLLVGASGQPIAERNRSLSRVTVVTVEVKGSIITTSPCKIAQSLKFFGTLPEIAITTSKVASTLCKVLWKSSN